MNHPSTGPITPEQLKTLAAQPHGKATTAIREHDPMWGRKEGEAIDWKVTFTREVTETAEVIVQAADEEGAEAIAYDIPDSKMNWEADDYAPGEGEIESIKPV